MNGTSLPVRTLTALSLVLLACLPARPGLGAQAGGRASDAVVKVAATSEKPDADGNQVVTLTLSIDKGWHVYANPVGNEDLAEAQTTVAVSGVKPDRLRVEYPPGKTIKDETVGNYKVYEGKVTIKARVRRELGDASPLEFQVRLQACNDRSCLKQSTLKLTVK